MSTSYRAKLCVTDFLRRDIHPDNDQQPTTWTSNLPVSQWCSYCCIIDTTPTCFPLFVITTIPALSTALRYTALRSDSLLVTMPEQQGPVRLGVKMHPPTILVEYYVKDPTQYAPQPQATENQKEDNFSRNTTSASKLRRKTVRLHNLDSSKVLTYVRTAV